MGNYTIFYMFDNPRRGRQARNFTTNVPKIVDLKSSTEQIFSENCRGVPLNQDFAHTKEHIPFDCCRFLLLISLLYKLFALNTCVFLF